MVQINSYLLLVASAALAVACGDDGRGSGDGNSDGGDGGSNPPPASCESLDLGGAVFYVAVDGDDESGDGSESAPWASIGHGIQQIPDGATILVGPGEYFGEVRLDEQFAQGVLIRSEPSYRARLRNDDKVVRSYYGQGITLSGFDIAHDGDSAGALIVHIQDLIDEPGGEDAVSRIVLHNNIIHDSYNNDLVKVNNGAKDILIERNLFYNQEGSDEHIDLNGVAEVVVQDNIFFNDFEASGREITEDTSSYIVVKDSNGEDGGYEGSEQILIRRNILMNWQGFAGSNFILLGEDGQSFHEAFDVMIENNLLVGNGTSVVRAPFGVKGGKDITFRHNTIVGDMPGEAYAFRFNQEGDNPVNRNISLYNNIWSDPSGSMEDFSDSPDGESENVELDNNLYWNGGAAIPEDDRDAINPSDDTNSVVADPMLPNNSLVPPTWNAERHEFADGSGDICAVFEKLVREQAAIAEASPAADTARSEGAADTDILGRPRGASPSIGAYEP